MSARTQARLVSKYLPGYDAAEVQAKRAARKKHRDKERLMRRWGAAWNFLDELRDPRKRTVLENALTYVPLSRRLRALKQRKLHDRHLRQAINRMKL